MRKEGIIIVALGMANHKRRIRIRRIWILIKVGNSFLRNCVVNIVPLHQDMKLMEAATLGFFPCPVDLGKEPILDEGFRLVFEAGLRLRFELGQFYINPQFYFLDHYFFLNVNFVLI